MRVLLVDDDNTQVSLLQELTRSWGHQAEIACDGVEALSKIGPFSPNVMVTDLKMPRMDGFELLEHLRKDGTVLPAIVLTAFGSIELALKAVHEMGAFWFLEKPVDTAVLRALLQKAADQGRLASENERLRHELAHRGVLGDLVGGSPAMRNLFALIRQVAPTNARVLISGESGSGKELVARAIHSFSPRASEPFLAINCAALPESLIESELFGHEKGTFTGAVERRMGAMELARGGTLFLDEIGEMPIQTQAKVLRVLEDFKFRRLGGKEEMVADVRLISATNRPPEVAIREGKLREDLYYRLNVFHIQLPPLREHIEDIPLIAAALIERLNKKHNTRVTHLDSAATEALMAHEWVGNVRELRNVIERAIILAGEGPLLRSHIQLQPHSVREPAPDPQVPQNLPVKLGMSIDEAARVLIEATLRDCGNNKLKAAAILGISTKTLYSKLKQYRSPDSTAEPLYETKGAGQ